MILAGIIVVGVIVPRVINSIAGADGIHDLAALPEQIQLCNRSWRKDNLERRFTLAETRTTFGVGVVVDPASDACPPGPCTDVAQPGPCQVVVWVRVGDDAYLGYELRGGP